MAETKSIKVSTYTYEIIKNIAMDEKVSMQSILDKLLKEYQTREFFREVNSAYEIMTPKDWQEEMEERKLLDNALTDDLEEDADETW
ncbi:MAG: hypothetical protein ABFD25_10840 [Clostridiaceae bacterium]